MRKPVFLESESKRRMPTKWQARKEMFAPGTVFNLSFSTEKVWGPSTVPTHVLGLDQSGTCCQPLWGGVIAERSKIWAPPRGKRLPLSLDGVKRFFHQTILCSSGLCAIHSPAFNVGLFVLFFAFPEMSFCAEFWNIEYCSAYVWG